MANPRCDAIKLEPREVPDLDGDGLPEQLFIYQVPQTAAHSFDVDCFKYKVMGEDSYCPAESLTTLLDDDGFPSLLSFLRLSSGKTFEQMKEAADADGRKFHVGQSVAYWNFFFRSPLTGVIDQFHADVMAQPDGTVKSDFHADMKLDDGRVVMWVPLKDLTPNDTWSQMKRGLSEFYWGARGKIDIFLVNH